MIKKYSVFVKEMYSSEIKDELADVIDVDKRKKDVEDIEKKISDTKERIENSKQKLQTEIDKLEKLEISDYSEENKKLLDEKIKKYKSDILELEELIKTFKEQLDNLKKS